MSKKHISCPRAMFNTEILENKKNIERTIMGGRSSGIVFDMTSEGIEINGYYEGFNDDTKYANMISPIFIPWEEFDKMRYRSEHKNKKVPDFVDEVPDKEYLSTLPIVHINDRKYYIDSTRRERRIVSNPRNVYKF